MPLKQIAQNPKLIENLFGNAANMGAALINEQDWFGNDGLLEKIPYGKIIVWIAQKVNTIDNIDEAFNHAYATAYFLCFSQAIKQYKAYLKNTDLVEIEEDRKAEPQFQLNNGELIDAEIFNHYSNKYGNLLTACEIPDKTKASILNYIGWNLKIVFHELLENKPVTYKKLCDELDKKSFSLRNEKLQITKYYQKQKNLFLSPVMGDEQGMTLKEVYIEPEYRIHKYCVVENELEKHFIESEFYAPDRKSVNVFVEPKHKDYNTIHGLLNDFVTGNPIKDKTEHPNTKAFILLGYPGQGKTSCIRKLLFDLIKDIENPELVYHLPLRSIENVTSFCNAPFEEIEEHMKGKNLPDYYARELVHKGTIILEGMDELAIQSGAKEKSIDEVLKELLRVQEIRNEVKLIITSRLGYIDCVQFKKKNLLIVQLKEFNNIQQLHWLRKYKGFYPECPIGEKDIVKFNHEDHHLKELINQPILLHMVATANIEITTNTNRSQLYKTLFDSLIERKWATNKDGGDKQIDVLKDLTPEDLREIIQDIALAIFHSGQNYIQKGAIEELDAVKRLMTQKLGFDKLGGALKGVMVSFYFQEVEPQEGNGNPDYGIEFLHKSLSEYMAAEKIWKEIKTFLVQASSASGYWVDSLKDALEKLNSLFAPQTLTLEVRDYIWEIMGNDAGFDRKKLSDRLAHFFPGLLQKEFLWTFDAGKADFPLKQALNTFYGYWTILSKFAADLHKNYLPEESLSEFVPLLRASLLLSPPLPSLNYQNLNGAKLQRADLKGADLEKADLREVNLKEADLKEAILKGAILQRANLYMASLQEAILEGANLREADLRGANLKGANLKGADLKGADLLGANIYKADLEGAILDGANLQSANLYMASLQEANLEGAILQRANLDGADLDGADLEGANLEGARLEGAIFDRCSIDHKNYEILKSKGVSIKDVTLKE